MRMRGESGARLREAAAERRILSNGLAGLYCAAFALIHVLFFHNQFYDINRCKYYLFVISAYSALVFFCAALVLERLWLKPGAPARPMRLSYPALGIAMMFLSAVVSTVLSGDPMASITGQNGRYAGLLFIGATAVLYGFAQFTRLPVGRVLAALAIGTGLCALLGVVNFLGWDPLGFYGTLQEKYKIDFLSTIGNINFFSACVCVLSGLSAGYFLRAEGWRRFLWLPVYCVSVIALLAARSDSAFIALAGLFLSMLFYRLRGGKECARAFLLFSASAASAFAAYWLCRARVGFYMDLKDSIAETLIRAYRVTGVAAVAFLIIALLLYLPKNKEKAARRLDIVQRVLGALALAALAAGFAAMVYFTYWNTERELPGFLARLRFSDTWGTFRGFIWNRTWRMYLDLPLVQKLFGAGPETLMKHIVANYNEEMIALTGITFDNAHNELIQYLFTLGVFGLGGYLWAIIGCYRLLIRRARESAALYAILLAVSAYLLQSLVNIAQPETTPVFFLLIALGCRKDEPGRTLTPASEDLMKSAQSCAESSPKERGDATIG